VFGTNARRIWTARQALEADLDLEEISAQRLKGAQLKFD
jgi:hypothetical protein